MKKTYRMNVTLSPSDIAYVEQDASALIDLWNWMVELYNQPTEDGKRFSHRYIVNRLNRTLMRSHVHLANIHRDLIAQRVKEFIKVISNVNQCKLKHHQSSAMTQNIDNGMYIRFSDSTASLMGKDNKTLKIFNLSPIDVSKIVLDGMIHKHGFQNVILKKTSYGEWHLLMTCSFELEQTILTRVQTVRGCYVDLPEDLLKLQKKINDCEIKRIRKKDGSLNQYHATVEHAMLKRIFQERINQL